MTFTEDWFADEACQALACLARKTNGLEGRVIEIGCWEGKSTTALANAVWPTVVDAVDTWAGSPGEISAELAKERDVHERFRQNVAALTRGNITEHRCDWRDYIPADTTPVRFCHIDATHTYREVVDNMRAVWPYIVAGGILCGDDIHHPPVRRAVTDVVETAWTIGPLWWTRK